MADTDEKPGAQSDDGTTGDGAGTERDACPAEVTDPLLWRLAAAVADTHQPDENGACDNGSCFAAPWPCAAWNRAQEALRAAQAPTAPAGDRHREPPPAWSPDPAAGPASPPPATAHLVVTSAA